jgi:hypothetical protein
MPLTSLTEERRAVLRAVVRRGGEGATLPQIGGDPEVRSSPASVRQLVLSLLDDGLVERTARGVYRATPKGVEASGLAGAAPSAGDGSTGAVPALLPPTVRTLPEYDVAANAGETHLFVGSAAEVGRYVVDAREIEGLPEGEGFVVSVYGTSMEPDFRPGELVICRRYRGGFGELVDGIYLLRVDGVAYIKALQRLPGRRVRVVSSSRDDFPPYEIDLNAPDDALDVEPLAVVWGKFRRYWE